MTEDSELTSYDSIAEVFTSHVARPDSWNNLYERPHTLARLPALQDKNVMELGCSSGFYTEYVLENGASVTAIDISEKLINRLADRIKSPKLRLVRADISRTMPFLESDTFDGAICSLVIDYIKDWGPLFAEVHRTLKNGGRLVISTHHPFAIYDHFKRHGKSSSYFDFKLVEDTWGLGTGRPFQTRYYMRPLEEILKPIIRSPFKIVSIDEPLPTEECKELAPDVYERLMERPGFLFIVLEK